MAKSVKALGLEDYVLNMFTRIFKGVKKGLSVPTLPSHLIELQHNIYIRMLRVTGGISIILIITKKLEFLGNGLLYKVTLTLCVIISILFSIYLMFININRIIHIYKTFKSDKL